MFSKRLRAGAGVAVLLAVFTTLRLGAQVERASLSGIISDKSGAAVPDVQVAAENLATAIKTATVTNASGNFYLTLLPGDYKISVSHQGFATGVVPQLTLSVGQQATLNLPLELSSVTQQVTVADVAPLDRSGDGGPGRHHPVGEDHRTAAAGAERVLAGGAGPGCESQGQSRHGASDQRWPIQRERGPAGGQVLNFDYQ